MDLAVDTNVVVAALLKAGLTRNLVFNDLLSLYAPERLPEEILRHEPEFVEKSGLSPAAFRMASSLVLSSLNVLPFEQYAGFPRQAKRISPDPDDWPFLAVALAKGVPALEQRPQTQTAGPRCGAVDRGTSRTSPIVFPLGFPVCFPSIFFCFCPTASRPYHRQQSFNDTFIYLPFHIPLNDT